MLNLEETDEIMNGCMSIWGIGLGGRIDPDFPVENEFVGVATAMWFKY